jgi:sodium/potassium-transporting ATPase subunit alpha
VAVADAYHSLGGDCAALAAGRRRHFAFDVARRREGGVHVAGDRRFFAVKGAWEALRPLLAAVRTGDGETVPMSNPGGGRAGDAPVAAAGLRVIAVAWRALADAGAETPLAELERDLVLAGFLGIEDPPRPEVPAAVATCHRAGIDVIMITGDHPDTALAVARHSGIVSPDADASRLLTGDVLERLKQAELVTRLAGGVRIFARTSPEQKMKIVAALKTMNKVVAMTGDGVNDAPALKAADVGIAMGRGGTDVARATAQIILLDDNFASIVAGVEEGRTVFANIRKFTRYVLASNVPEIFPYLLYILLPVPLALTVIQILAIDLGTDMIPAIALGQEPPEPEVMGEPPRDPHAGLLTGELLRQSYLFLGLIEAGWSLLLFFFVLVQGGWHFGQEMAGADALYRSATGIALASVLLLQVGNLLGRRFQYRSGLDLGLLRNRLMLLGIALEVAFSWALLYWPPLQRVLATGPVSLEIYLLAWLGIPLIFGLDFLRKRLRRPLPRTA